MMWIVKASGLYWCGIEYGGWLPSQSLAVRYPTRDAAQAQLKALGHSHKHVVKLAPRTTQVPPEGEQGKKGQGA